MQKVARVKKREKGEEKDKKKVGNEEWQKIAIACKYGDATTVRKIRIFFSSFFFFSFNYRNLIYM